MRSLQSQAIARVLRNMRGRGRSAVCSIPKLRRAMSSRGPATARKRTALWPKFGHELAAGGPEPMTCSHHRLVYSLSLLPPSLGATMLARRRLVPNRFRHHVLRSYSCRGYAGRSDRRCRATARSKSRCLPAMSFPGRCLDFGRVVWPMMGPSASIHALESLKKYSQTTGRQRQMMHGRARCPRRSRPTSSGMRSRDSSAPG